MDNISVSKEWFKYAERDLESAIFLIKMHPVPIEIICYHCEQSAEKYLKGYLILKQNNVEKTHDLGLLNKKSLLIEPAFCEIEDECLELIPYGVQVRYPYELEVNEQDMKSAIACAEKIQRFIIDLL